MSDEIDKNEKKCDNDITVIKLENGATIELGPLCPPISDFEFTIKDEKHDNTSS